MTSSQQGIVLASGISMLLIGAAVAVIAFILNASTPVQLGPVPFFTGCLVALVGLIATIVAIIR